MRTYSKGYKMYVWVKNVTHQLITKHELKAGVISIGYGSNRHSFINQNAGFDIETTQIYNQDPETNYAYMYIWSLTFNKLTILGSTWSEFIELLDLFIEHFDLNEKNRMLIFIANMSFEFQFMRKHLTITKSFFTEERKPLYLIHKDGIEFRDALQITGGNLATLAKNYTKTQKLVGELDYTIPRNHEDGRNLKPGELQYVLNDTIILSEFMEYYFRTFAPLGFLPLTKTGILRHEVKEDAKTACKKQHMKLENIISALHPFEKLYDVMMKYLFRGGYVHGANRYAGLILENLSGVDLVSSYPAHMLLENGYPMGKFIKVGDNIPIDQYLDLNKEYATMALIEFDNLDVTTAHSIESINKVVKASEYHLDNGRILDSEKIQVFLTELDFDIYTKFYKWSSMRVLKCWKAKRGALPDYLLNNISRYYEKKSRLKKEGKQGTTDYALSKEMVNSGYGLTVTRMRKNTVVYDPETHKYDTDDSFIFQKEVSKQALLPQWGIWVTAYARHTLLDMVYRIDQEAKNAGRECDAVYMDTDSIKILNTGEHINTINKYNNMRECQVREMCTRRGLDYELFKGLGSFDLELPYIKRFRHNGAKRYLMKFFDFKNHEYITKATIAGLPKKALLAYANKYHFSVWDLFTNQMKIPEDESYKLAAIYNDEPHYDYVNGERMEELSSVCLKPIEFTLKIDTDYMKYVNEAERRLKQKIL